MGYGRPRKNWKSDRRNDGRRGRARPRLALAGAATLATGILLIFYVADVRSFDHATLIGVLAVFAGAIMLPLSLNRKNQKRFVKGMDMAGDLFKERCQCCKCQNCGRDHNHWTHD